MKTKPTKPLYKTLIIKFMIGVFFLLFTADVFPATITVNSISGLSSAIANANPGDIIVMKNGIYTTSGAIGITRSGTATQPITITAETIGGVEIRGTAGFDLNSPSSYIIIKGFKFTHTGRLNMDLGTHHCRITRNVFQTGGSSTEYLWVQGLDHEIDYNTFQNKTSAGAMVKVDASGRDHSGTKRAYFHHNYFFNHAFTGSNGGESIATWGGFTRVEYNLFEKCDGDPEIITIKASDGIYKYNTFRDANRGQLVLRYCNRVTIQGNFLINTKGLRAYGEDNKIINNYFENNQGTAIMVSNGATGYIQIKRMLIAFNTMIEDGITGRSGDTPPTDVTIANNIIVKNSGTFINETTPYVNPVYEGNILWGSAAIGSIPSSGYRKVDPKLVRDANGIYHLSSTSPAINTASGTYDVTDDFDGQLRNVKDVGADEFSSEPITRKVLKSTDVGPNAGTNNSPTASITSPASGATFTAPASIAINANATDSDGTVTKVEFFQGAVKLGEDLTSPYSFTWSNVSSGSYTLTVKSTDDDGATTTSSAISVIVNDPGPAPIVFNPLHDAYVRTGVNANTAYGVADSITLMTKLAPATQMDNGRETYLMFDLSGVSGSITSVQLKVFGKIEDATATNIPVGVYAVASTSWTESTLTWNNKPAAAATSLQSTTVTDATARYYTWDITNYVKNEVIAGRKKISLAMKSEAEHNPRILWNAAEASSSPPQLAVVADANVDPTVSITSPSSGSTFTAPATISINANAADSDGTISKVEFFSGAAKLGEDVSSPYSFSWNNVSAGSYSLTAVATDNDGASTTSAVVNVTVNEVATLPAPWNNTDIGTVAASGSASFATGIFTVNGSGADIWGTADEFHYVYQPVNGDVEIVTRVTSLTNTHAWAKAGVMIRETLAPGSIEASLIVSAASGVSFQRRTASGGTTVSTVVAGTAAPVWLRLTRSGSTFTASSSVDGTTWTTIGTAAITMTASVQIGLAVTSHADGTVATGTFSNVNVTYPCGLPIASTDDGNVPANVIDNDFNTRWSALGDPQWIQLCLPTLSSVTGVQIAFFKGNERTSTFDVLVSTDGVNFTTAQGGFVSSGTSLAFETFNFAAKTARFVRIVGHGNNLNLWNSFTEVRINTSPAPPPAAEEIASQELIILSAYPSPATDRLTISFQLKEASQVRLSLYNGRNNQSSVLLDEYMQAGKHQTLIDMQQMSQGLYLLRLNVKGETSVQKVVKQ